jgi:phage-related protein
VAEKPVVFVGSTLDRLRAFPAAARQGAGHELFLVQCGLDPDDWKPLRAVGAGVFEIRVHVGGEFRVLYIAKFPEAVYALHAFEKKTQQTRQADIELGRKNLAWVRQARRQE